MSTESIINTTIINRLFSEIFNEPNKETALSKIHLFFDKSLYLPKTGEFGYVPITNFILTKPSEFTATILHTISESNSIAVQWQDHQGIVYVNIYQLAYFYENGAHVAKIVQNYEFS